MKTKALMQALKFACLPTLSLLILLFFAFFSISKTIDFISSNNRFAIALRIITFLGEVALVYLMYRKYLKEEKIRIILNKDIKDYEGSPVRFNKEIYLLFPNQDYNKGFTIHRTEFEDILLIRQHSKV